MIPCTSYLRPHHFHVQEGRALLGGRLGLCAKPRGKKAALALVAHLCHVLRSLCPVICALCLMSLVVSTSVVSLWAPIQALYQVKKSRFLKKERKVELSYKDQVEPTPPEVPRRRRKEVTTPIFVLNFLPLFQAKPLPELKKPETEEKKTEVWKINFTEPSMTCSLFYPGWTKPSRNHSGQLSPRPRWPACHPKTTTKECARGLTLFFTLTF